jgi:hypothetical protein
MAMINIELPLLVLAVACLGALVAWLLGTFSVFLRDYRYRVSLGSVGFALSGLMGFFCTLRLEVGFFGDWFSAHSPSWLIGTAYVGYLIFGFLGCWTALRIGERLDRKHTLSVLHSIMESKKKSVDSKN